MKKTIILIIAILFSAHQIFAQSSESRSLDSFTQIDYEGYGELYLVQSDSFGVTIDARKHHHLDEIITEVRGNTLHIFHNNRDEGWFQKNTRFPRTVITINYRNLDELDLKGKVKLFSDAPIRSENFELNLSGYVVGDLEVYVQDIEVETEGYAKMNLSGEAKSFEGDFDGLGKFSALDLFTDYCDVEVEGTTTVEVYAREQIDATISGVSTFYYEGNPSKTNIDRNGLVRVRSCRN